MVSFPQCMIYFIHVIFQYFESELKLNPFKLCDFRQNVIPYKTISRLANLLKSL